MEIKVNNVSKKISEQGKFTLQQLLDAEIPGAHKGIAVAVNSNVIPKNNWNDHALLSGDEILIIKATQGG
ncbi:MAG: sulfur carrier protein ThiS [Bacteroidetes bacterium]|nr:sulfur carrier protein ThiS [Bacteroidota bacterium]